MAKLEGRDPKIGSRWFSLTPVQAKEPDQDAKEYVFELWPGPDNEVWTRNFSVAGWFMGQDDVWVLARAFAETSTLISTTIPVDLWHTGRGISAHLSEHVDWLHIDLWGNKKQKWVNIILYVLEIPDTEIFRRAFLRTNLETVVHFGQQLEKEIIEASPNWAKENNHSPK